MSNFFPKFSPFFNSIRKKNDSNIFVLSERVLYYFGLMISFECFLYQSNLSATEYAKLETFGNFMKTEKSS